MKSHLPPMSWIALTIAIIALACSIVAVMIAGDSLSTAREARDSNPFVAGSEAREEAQRNSNRIRSSTQIRQLAMAILSYASQHDDEAPNQATWRQDLIDADIVNPDIFTPEGGADVEHAYHYIRPTQEQILAIQESGTSKVVVLYEDPDLWPDGGGHMTYLDTTTEWIEGDAYRERVDSLRTDGPS